MDFERHDSNRNAGQGQPDLELIASNRRRFAVNRFLCQLEIVGQPWADKLDARLSRVYRGLSVDMPTWGELITTTLEIEE